jgi:hypothetical protein
MLFAKKRPSRLSDAEIEIIRRRAKSIQSQLVGRPSNLADVFAQVGENDFGFRSLPVETTGPSRR